MLNEIKQTWQMREVWMRMGMNEIRRNYRRTKLGPFWVTITMGIFISTLGVMYSSFWKVDIATYLPYLCAGFLLWGPLSSIINEGCSLYISNEHIIKQIHPPFSLFAFALVYRHLITFGHHFVIFVILVLLLPVPVNMNTLLLIPGIFLFFLNGIWASMLFGLINTRFRDIQPLVASLMQLLFFLTPIFWMPELMGEDRKIFINANPFHHFIEIVRDPLLGTAPASVSWITVLCITVLGYAFTSKLYSKYSWRITYWL